MFAFFSKTARNLPRNEMLLVGILIEKGAVSRGVVLKTSKLVTMSGLPGSLFDKALARLMFLGIVSRRASDRNFEYRLLPAGMKRIRERMFPDRTSLTAKTGIRGYGRLPFQTTLFGEEKPLVILDADLRSLRKLQRQLDDRARDRPRRSGEAEQLRKLVELMVPYDATTPGITAREVLDLEKGRPCSD
jgi:hypothetical protein